jgi:hypothetical protein
MVGIDSWITQTPSDFAAHMLIFSLIRGTFCERFYHRRPPPTSQEVTYHSHTKQYNSSEYTTYDTTDCTARQSTSVISITTGSIYNGVSWRRG